jgi:CRP/FNR family transcriptional regulator
MAQKPRVGHERSRDLAVALLRDGPWSSLPVDTVTRLVVNGRTSDIPAGRTIYAEADTERLGVIVAGLLRVYMHTADGRQVTVRYVRPGSLLGVPALVGGPAPVFVQALTDSTIYLLDVEHVKHLARHDAAVAWTLAEESVHRLYDVLEELAGNTFATVRPRVVRHLLALASSRPSSGGPLIARVSQQDLANSVGSVREVIRRRTPVRRVLLVDLRRTWSAARGDCRGQSRERVILLRGNPWAGAVARGPADARRDRGVRPDRRDAPAGGRVVVAACVGRRAGPGARA